MAVDGANQWGKRTNAVGSLLKKHSPDVLCIQEGLYNQILDLQTMLPYYFYVGVGRDDGKEKGEFSAIFFKKSIYCNTFLFNFSKCSNKEIFSKELSKNNLEGIAI